MAPALYDARGNTYFVALPEEVRELADLPQTASEAAGTREQWARVAVDRICGLPNVAGESSVQKRFQSDGLLVGPFPDRDAFGLLIVNTDGTLAERSGNGLTIFSQYLADTGKADGSDSFVVRITTPVSSIEARIEPSIRDGRSGFWIDMGLPAFGPEAVAASPEDVGSSAFEGRVTSRVFALEEIDESWTCSQFVNVGNPHCVTFLEHPQFLPSMEQLGSQSWLPRLSAIANHTQSDGMPGAGRPCRSGVNLQWASVVGPDRIEARVFERGEGPTRSSGSSATAVASAARKLGLVDAEIVQVLMPGGIAPVRFVERDASLERAMLFGEARRVTAPETAA